VTKFKNPDLQEAFVELNERVGFVYKVIEDLNHDIKALEDFVADKPIPYFYDNETGLSIGKWGGNKKVLYMHPKANELRPMLELSLHDRTAAGMKLARFIKNFTESLK